MCDVKEREVLGVTLPFLGKYFECCDEIRPNLIVVEQLLQLFNLRFGFLLFGGEAIAEVRVERGLTTAAQLAVLILTIIEDFMGQRVMLLNILQIYLLQFIDV